MAPGAVPESVLRKRRRDDDWAAKRAAAGNEVSTQSNRKAAFWGPTDWGYDEERSLVIGRRYMRHLEYAR